MVATVPDPYICPFRFDEDQKGCRPRFGAKGRGITHLRRVHNNFICDHPAGNGPGALDLHRGPDRLSIRIRSGFSVLHCSLLRHAGPAFKDQRRSLFFPLADTGRDSGPHVQLYMAGQQSAALDTPGQRSCKGAGDHSCRILCRSACTVCAQHSLPYDLQKKGAVGILSCNG